MIKKKQPEPNQDDYSSYDESEEQAIHQFVAPQISGPVKTDSEVHRQEGPGEEDIEREINMMKYGTPHKPENRDMARFYDQRKKEDEHSLQILTYQRGEGNHEKNDGICEDFTGKKLSCSFSRMHCNNPYW